MKIASSLKSLKKRDLNSKLVKRRGKVYIINKKILNSKLVKDKMDDKENERLMLALQSLFFGDTFGYTDFSNSSYNLVVKITTFVNDSWIHKRRFSPRKKSCFNT